MQLALSVEVILETAAAEMMPTGLHYVGDKMLMIHLLCCRTWTQSTSVVYQKRLLASASCVFPLIHRRQFMRTAPIMFFRTIALSLSSSAQVVYLQHVSSADNVHNVVTQCRIYTTIRCNQSRSAASSWHIRQHEDITHGRLKIMNQQNKDIFVNCNWCAESKIVIITINNNSVTGPTVSSAVSAVQGESIYTVSFTACFTETPPACKCSIRGLSPIWIRGPHPHKKFGCGQQCIGPHINVTLACSVISGWLRCYTIF